MTEQSVELLSLYRALGDPIRLEMLEMMSQVDELACTALDERLPITKSTISYHVKFLRAARLIDVRKAGRNYFYTLRTDVLDEHAPTLLDQLRNS